MSQYSEYIPNTSTDDGSPGVNTPKVSKQDFAEQVRTSRLDILWRATLAFVFLFMWLIILLSSSIKLSEQTSTIFPMLAASIGSLFCRYFLKQDLFIQAVWAYALGVLIAIGFAMSSSNDTVLEIIPFTGIMLVFVIGMLLPTRNLIPLALLTGATLIIAPSLTQQKLIISEHTSFALILIVLASLLSAQASGDLYGIAEWALENYKRERQTATRLFESRYELERSLNWQRALGSELKDANESLEEARRAAEEAKHFRGQFLANMSHELRTPLNAVIGFSETMLNFPPMYNNVELPSEYRQDLNQINTSGKHLLNIINDILDLSKIDAGRLDIELQKVELEPIFRGVMSTAVGLLGGRPVKLLRDTPSPLPDVSGDPVRLRQVLLNLYSNAAKFTETGNITLTLRINDNNKSVTISVSDTGEGIERENLLKIFEEFRQGKMGRRKGREGAGLGLSISRQLLSLMGGEIWADSTPGEGSNFYFSLPIYEEEETEESSTDSETEPETVS